MTFALIVVLALIYIPALAMLFVYSANLYYLVLLTMWRRRNLKSLPTSKDLPFVTVQIPLYNERYVGRRIVDAVAQLDWPQDRLEIQVLDDSTDETRDIIAEAVAKWQEKGINIVQVCRPERTGYKAGALSYGLQRAKGDYIAIFDADFIPAKDFLHQTVPALLNAPDAAFIQARWEHVNQQDSWLTRIQAIAIDGHFAIEQFARYHGGYAFNFNGTAGVWRRTAIDDAGGWKYDTLTEDLDLSYRAWLRGWKGLYRHDISSPAELPPTMAAFRRQQARWAQGSIECARMLIAPVWRSSYSLMAKLQATIHLLGYLVNPIMAMLVMIYPLIILVTENYPESIAMFSLFNGIGPMTAAPTIFFLFSQYALRRRGWRAVVAVTMFHVISAGLAMNTLRATLKALTGQRGEFLRTPKWGGEKPTVGTYRVRADVGVLTDLTWGFFCFVIMLVALSYGHLFIGVYALISCIGSMTVALWTIAPELSGMLRPRSLGTKSVEGA
jgi:cellulose synthase/poly-beta-1,6-N-acetylglucosamine synthase-like glycosyltransferase